MKILILVFLAFALFYLVSFTIMSIQSSKPHKAGLENGKLRECPNTPNCVSSEEKGKPSFIEPIIFTGSSEKAWKNLKLSVQELGGKIEQETDTYIWATFRSKLWHFVDDAEFVLDTKEYLIKVRSASRVGKGDLGVNRKRVEALRGLFKKKQY